MCKDESVEVAGQFEVSVIGEAGSGVSGHGVSKKLDDVDLEDVCPLEGISPLALLLVAGMWREADPDPYKDPEET